MSNIVMRGSTLLLLLLTACTVWAQERYTYTGEPFENYESPYQEGDRISGWFDIDEPLEPYLVGEDILGRLVDYRFQDGVEDFRPIGSTACRLRVWTDGVGAIVLWEILVAEAPIAQGNPQRYMFTESFFTFDEVGTWTAGDAGCPDTMGSPDADAYNIDSPGAWTTTADTTPQPTNYNYQGQTFLDIEAPNQPGDAVSGSITLDAPLPSNVNGFGITALVTAFSFTDGQDVFNESDGVLCSASVGTDLWGRIDHWELTIGLNADTSEGVQRVLFVNSQGVQGRYGPGDFIESGSWDSGPPCFPSPAPATLSGTEDPGEWFSDAYPTVEQTRYQYRGEPYEFVAGSGELGGRAGAYVEFDGKLPANLELEPLEDIVVEFWFGDSLQSRTPANSELCDFRFSTDADGEISEWEIILREIPKPVLGEPQQNFEIRHFGSNKSSIGLTQTESDPCGALDETDYQRTSFPGTWQPPDPMYRDRFEQQTQ